MRVEGVIQVDVCDYSDEITFHADCDDILELMEDNHITAGEMIDYLRDGEYPLDIDQVYQWLETSDVQILSAVCKKCIDLLRHEYTEAEEGRIVHMKRANELEAEQKVITGGPHVREV